MFSDFAKQFVELEEENARLKLELEEARKLAADAHLRVDVAEKDKAKIKKSLDKEVAAREEAKTKIDEKEVQLRHAVESLLNEFFRTFVAAFDFSALFVISFSSLCFPVATDIPVNRAARLRIELLEDSIVFAVD
jgi:chromosome segregation ATPase